MPPSSYCVDGIKIDVRLFRPSICPVRHTFLRPQNAFLSLGQRPQESKWHVQSMSFTFAGLQQMVMERELTGYHGPE